MTRAQWWRNTFNTESGYIHPRNADGSWPWPLNPASQSQYIEGNARSTPGWSPTTSPA